MNKFFKQSLIIFFSVCLLAEIALRVSGKYRINSEVNGQGYDTDYGKIIQGWGDTYPPNHPHQLTTPDFKYVFEINSLGIRGKDFVKEKNDSVIRILVTGDSFAEGVGAGYDSTWPMIVEKKLNDLHLRVEILNGSVGGSDIFFDYIRFRDTLASYKPDIVLASFNSSDYIDFLTRGGMERFVNDGTTRFRKPPDNLFLYKHSFLWRALRHKFFDYLITGLFVSSNDYRDTAIQSTKIFAAIFHQYDSLSNANKAKFIALIHSSPVDIFIHPVLANANIEGLNQLADTLLKAMASLLSI